MAAIVSQQKLAQQVSLVVQVCSCGIRQYIWCLPILGTLAKPSVELCNERSDRENLLQPKLRK